MRGRDFISLLGGAAAPALGTPLFAQTAAKRARITSRGSDLTDDQKPTVPYWHLYTDENGISRQRRCLMTRFELKSIQPPADPQWQGVRYHDGMTTMVIVLPVAWVGTWHEIRHRSGSFRCRAVGGWSPWTANALRWGPATFHSGKIKAASSLTVESVIVRGQLALSPPC
jgi:hypothetical protein